MTQCNAEYLTPEAAATAALASARDASSACRELESMLDRRHLSLLRASSLALKAGQIFSGRNNSDLELLAEVLEDAVRKESTMRRVPVECGWLDNGPVYREEVHQQLSDFGKKLEHRARMIAEVMTLVHLVHDLLTAEAEVEKVRASVRR